MAVSSSPRPCYWLWLWYSPSPLFPFPWALHTRCLTAEDLYMGLLLHRLRKNYKIQAEASTVVTTFTPESFSALFRQRTTSWDLCAQRKVLAYLRVSVWLLF